MTGKLIVNIAQLRDGHRAAIAAAASAHGYQAVFCDTPEAALAAAGEAEIIFGANAPLLKAAPKLRWLCVPSAGAEQYLSTALYASPDALLSNSSGAYGVTIAEHVIMSALMLMRRQLDYADVVGRRGWLRTLPVRSIRDSRVTLLGTGDIGQEVALRVRAFGPRSVVGVNRSGRNPGDMFDRVVSLDGLDAVLPETDLLVMSLPGTPETRGIMDEGRLRRLPDDAFLVNVGRGSAIDQAALEALLRAGHLSGAALDVFETEPLPPESTLWDCPRLLITPHVAGNMTLGYTVDAIVRLFLEDFENYCAGRPLKRFVARAKGY